MSEQQSSTRQDASSDFFWRRVHSLMGFLLVLFIIEHLLTNSQAALLLGDDGIGFVRMVNLIHSLPYLPAIEIGVLALPIIVHAVWGIRYLLTAEPNSYRSDGSKPALGAYPRNRAYTLQRITSWILLFAIVGHVAQMRFIKYPVHAEKNGQHQYIVKLSMDQGLYTVADRLGVQLYDSDRIAEERLNLPRKDDSMVKGIAAPVSFEDPLQPVVSEAYDPTKAERLLAGAEQYENRSFVKALEKFKLDEGEVNAVADNMGTAILLTVRDTFKSPVMAVLYSVFVIAAVYHAFNGLWTFLITWGITLTAHSQTKAKRITNALMLGVLLLGLVAIWGTYWLNLRY